MNALWQEHSKMIIMIYSFLVQSDLMFSKKHQKNLWDHWHFKEIKRKRISQSVLANLFLSASRRAVDRDLEILSMTSVGGQTIRQHQIQPGDPIVVTKCVPNTHKHSPHTKSNWCLQTCQLKICFVNNWKCFPIISQL